MSNILYLPEDPRDLLMVSAQDLRDFDGMIAMNQASADWLSGRLDTGTYFDTLDHFGIDPITFVRPVEELAYGGHITVELLL